MGLLRLLLALVGDALLRLGRALRSWAGMEPSQEPEQIEDQTGPPEHLVRYLRERAPWLLVGKRPLPMRAVPPRRPPPPSEPGPPGPASPASSATPIPQSDVVAPAAPKPESIQARATQNRVPLLRAMSEPTARDAGVKAVPSKADRERRSPAASESERSPVQPTAGSAQPSEQSIAAPPLAARGPGPASATRASIPASNSWPSLPPFRLDVGAEEEDVTTEEGVTTAIVEDPEAGVDPRDRRSAFEPSPENGIPVSQPHPARVAATAATAATADEGGQWATLPDKGFEEWEVQSIRSLLREQLHLTRLLAEQVGYSWSAPHS